MKPQYHAHQYARGRWHIIDPSGIPLYDGAPYGKDKPLIFRDEDQVAERVKALNEREEYEAFVRSMIEHCHCEPADLRPCDGVLAGGVCDGAKEEPEKPRCTCWDEPGDADCEEHCP